MIRLILLLLIAGGTTFTARAESLQFDPYNGTTTLDSSTATSSEYLAGSTASGEGMTASPLGLTPGFWKNVPKKIFAWEMTPYTTTDKYNVVFGVNHGDITLLDALNHEGDGNGPGALARSAVAALLNATNPYVNYLYTEAQIKSWVVDAYLTQSFESLKTKLDDANNGGGELVDPNK